MRVVAAVGSGGRRVDGDERNRRSADRSSVRAGAAPRRTEPGGLGRPPGRRAVGRRPAGDGAPHGPGLRVGAAQGASDRRSSATAPATGSASIATRSTASTSRRGWARPGRARRRIRRCGGGARGGARASGAGRRSTTSPSSRSAGRGGAARGAASRRGRGADAGTPLGRAARGRDRRARAADARPSVSGGAPGAAHDRPLSIGSPGRCAARLPGHPRRARRGLGIVPSPRLRRLEEQILLQDPDLDLAPSHSDAGPPDEPMGREPVPRVARLPRGRSRRASSARTSSSTASSRRVVGATRFTALVGPSGSGKSSVVQAGLVPRCDAITPTCSSPRCSPDHSPTGCSKRRSVSSPASTRGRSPSGCAGRGRAARVRLSRCFDGRIVAIAPRRRPVRGAVHDGRRRRGDAGSSPCWRTPPTTRAGTSTSSSRCAPTSTTGRWRIRAWASCSPTTS